MSVEKQDYYTFTWRIKNYSSCYLVKGQCIRSPSFTIETPTLSGCQWCLSIYPKGDNSVQNEENDITCFLKWEALNESIETATISFGIGIVDEKDVVSEWNDTEDQKFSDESSSSGWAFFFDMDEEMNRRAEDILTLQCRIKIDEPHKQTIIGSEACTTFDVDHFCVEWNAELPSLFEYSESITFPILDLCNFDITLNSVLEALEILIHFKNNKSEVSQQLTFTFSLFNKIGFKLGSKRAVHLFEKEETWKFPEFITKELLKSCEKNSSHYEFNLNCKVCLSKKKISHNFIEKLIFASPCSLKSIPKDNPTSSIQKEFRKLFISKHQSDVSIRAKNDEFPAHKFVLRLRSPVFAAMFDQDMLENKTGVVDIDDLDGETLKAFLEYLYTESVEGMDYDTSKRLMLAADKYQVPSLVDECASVMKSEISVENACEIISIADLISCEHLKSHAFNFIKVNAGEILPTAAWTEWIEGNIKLATYVLSKLSVATGTEYKLI